jgi:hypothetical protein
MIDLSAAPISGTRKPITTTSDRRSFMTATAALVAAGSVAEARECTRNYDWETM